MNTEKVSIETFLQWRRDMKGSGIVQCSPTATGFWQGMPLPWNRSNRQNWKKRNVILFVLNNELKWKRLCICSIYVVNIISKQNKSTKNILFHLIVFSFLFNPPFHIIFERFFFALLLTVLHLNIFISVMNQLDAQNFCFTISLFHSSTCFEHICSSSVGQNCVTQPLVSSHTYMVGYYIYWYWSYVRILPTDHRLLYLSLLTIRQFNC